MTSVAKVSFHMQVEKLNDFQHLLHPDRDICVSHCLLSITKRTLKFASTPISADRLTTSPHCNDKKEVPSAVREIEAPLFAPFSSCIPPIS